MMDFALVKKKKKTNKQKTFGSGRGPTSLQPFESSKDAHFQRKSAMVTKLFISSVRRSDTEKKLEYPYKGLHLLLLASFYYIVREVPEI